MIKLLLVALFVTYAIVFSIALGRAGYRSRSDAEGAVESARHPGQPARTAPATSRSVRGEGPREHPGRLLIVGATGGTGRQLVARALERGYAVTAFVRDPSRLQVEHPHLTVARGDVLDGASVEAAMRGQDAVVSALGHRRYFSLARVLSRGTRNVLRAMETQGVRRLVCQTSLGIGDSAWRMGLPYTFFTIPVVLPLYFWDKTRQERLIAESPVEWVIVRPGALTNAGRRGRVRHGRRVGSVLWTVRVSRADIAEFMLDQLTSDAYLRSAPDVAW